LSHFVGIYKTTQDEKGYKIKQKRSFSGALRKQIVGQIELKELSITQVSREYQVSKAAIYNWPYRYSSTLKKVIRMVMEKDSKEKSSQELKERIKELEAALGRKSLESDLFRVIVDLASGEYKTDLKKLLAIKCPNHR
jgi:transposase-like protein